MSRFVSAAAAMENYTGDLVSSGSGVASPGARHLHRKDTASIWGP
jgi:hypothetical protein